MSPTALVGIAADQEQSNYIDVTVIPSGEHASVTRSSELDPFVTWDLSTAGPAIEPSDPDALSHAVDRIVARLLQTDRHAGGPTVLAVTGETLRGTNWRSYRAGRARAASLSAMYLRWFAPDPDCVHLGSIEVAGRLLHRFVGPSGTFADLVVVGELASVPDEVLAGPVFDAVGAVRVLPVTEPQRAEVHDGHGPSVRLIHCEARHG